jgi:transposase InsO family protein
VPSSIRSNASGRQADLACAGCHAASRWRTAALTRYFTDYNTRRRHSGIAMCTPAERLAARL